MQCHHLQMKYNPCGESLLRTIFLKHENHIEGRYLAELTRELFADLEETKYQLVEYRLSIYGRKRSQTVPARYIIAGRLHQLKGSAMVLSTSEGCTACMMVAAHRRRPAHPHI